MRFLDFFCTKPSRDWNFVDYSRPGRVWYYVSDIPAGDGKSLNLYLQCRKLALKTYTERWAWSELSWGQLFHYRPRKSIGLRPLGRSTQLTSGVSDTTLPSSLRVRMNQEENICYQHLRKNGKFVYVQRYFNDQWILYVKKKSL